MVENPMKSISYAKTKHVEKYMETSFITLNENVSTRLAAQKFKETHVTYLIVINNDNEHVGIVTDDDILYQVSDETTVAEKTILKDTMSPNLITIPEKSTLQDALTVMTKHHINRLPVTTKKGRVIGVIHKSRISNIIRDSLFQEPRLLSPPTKAVLGNLGFVLQFAGVLLLVPAVLATLLEDPLTASGIYLSTVLLLVTGFFLNSYGEKSNLNLQQASILVFSSLFLLALFGTIPYLYVFGDEYSGVELFSNAFFSSAAGFTTGGISIIDTPEDLSQSFTFFRSYTQFVGGMSFIYLVITAFYPESKLQSMRGFISGRTLHMKELFLTITMIFTLYITIVAVLFYISGQQNIIDNFSLAMSTLATGGFTPTSTFLSELVWHQNLILLGAMILGALPFTFHYSFVRKSFLSPRLGKEVSIYFIILLIGMILFVFTSGMEPLQSMFYTISASTTAGLQHDSLVGLNNISYYILIILMLIGGCGFSTAGGLKVFRLVHLTNIVTFLRHVRNPRFLNISTRKELLSTLIIIALFPLIAHISAIHLSATEDVPYQLAFFESIGVITTGGLSAGVIDIDTSPDTKIFLSFLMIFGRLEIIAIIYIFIPKLSAN